jgi:hypothetical protein
MQRREALQKADRAKRVQIKVEGLLKNQINIFINMRFEIEPAVTSTKLFKLLKIGQIEFDITMTDQ